MGASSRALGFSLGVPPTYIGPKNCESTVGLNWRRVREMADRMGIELVPAGRALLVPHDAFVTALERKRASGDDAPTDPRAAVLAAMGRTPR